LVNNGEILFCGSKTFYPVRSDLEVRMSEATARSTPNSHTLRRTLSALRYRNYRLYWFGQLFSVLAQNMELVALGWLVLELTNSPLVLGLTGLAQAIPTITLTLVGGVVADRADRRRIMIASQACTAVMFFIVATLVVTGWVRLWQVMTLAFVSGCVKAFDRPSKDAAWARLASYAPSPAPSDPGHYVLSALPAMPPAVPGTPTGPTQALIFGACWFGSPSVISNSPDGVNLRTVLSPLSTQNTLPSGAIDTAWGLRKTPLPQLSTTFPSVSNTIMGLVPLLKT